MAEPVVNNPGSLERLSEAGYEIAQGEPDVRGWDVVLGADEKIGEVDDLIIDPAAGKVRYLDIDLDRGALQLDHDRHVAVPIARARLDRDAEEVVPSGIDRSSILQLPEFRGSAIARGYDEAFPSRPERDADASRQRTLTRSAEDLQVGKRVEKAGDVKVSKHVETEHVRQSVPVERERVRVERRPVEHAVGSADIGDDQIVVPVTEERVVVEKRPVVKEEVVISKERVTENEPVEADLRRERIDVEPSSDRVRVDDETKGRGGE